MKHLLVLLITLILFGNVKGQKIELSISLNSGLYSFAGFASASSAILETSPQTNTNLTSNAWGTRSRPAYGVSFNLRKVTRMNYFYGVDMGYEMLRSSMNITSINEYILNSTGTISSVNTYNSTGRSYLNNSFINFNPFVGYRFTLREISLDLSAGLDIGYCLQSIAKGKAVKSDGTTYNSEYDNYAQIKWDIRPRIHLLTSYKKVGVYVGYSYGVTNYIPSSPFVTESRLFRFGVTYLLKH